VRRLRPHAKTHKSKEATQLLIEAGIQKFKCATIAEAEMLAMWQCERCITGLSAVWSKAGTLYSIDKKNTEKQTFPVLLIILRQLIGWLHHFQQMIFQFRVI
jgi:D-serine deaminase-like pyridoxal phosphate-dependent protein